MRRTKRNSGFLVSYSINLLLNLDGTIPAWILLALHFLFGLPIWLFIGALALWAINILVRTLIISWAAKCSSIPDPVLENKNPYSSKIKNPYSAGDKNNQGTEL